MTTLLARSRGETETGYLIVMEIGQELVEFWEESRANFLRCLAPYTPLILSLPASIYSTYLIISRNIFSVTPTSQLLPSMNNNDVESFVFRIGIGTEIALRHSEGWAGRYRWNVGNVG